ncbi:MAG: Uma2 family endonuclease [Thermomicrobiales bacterium]|nr:Uma2 family endonuclease [Thermomicrobiales bacterium]MCA9880852.1 Uma2 family endonuclease [Thermomicrobiales bacterium]
MVATRSTVAEFEATSGDDRVELIDGEIVEMPPSSDGSSSIAATIAFLLGLHVRPSKLGRIYNADAGFVLFPDRATVRVPDVAFVRADRMPQGEARRHFPRLAPDLAVEVLSPTDRDRDVRAKVAMYQEAGMPLIWLVDPDAQTVTVLALGQEPVTLTVADTLDGGDVLPDLRLEVAEIFA